MKRAAARWVGFTVWVRWLVLLSALVAVATGCFPSLKAPPPPAFYTPPSPLPAGAPGTIIRQEPLTEDLPKGAVAWRILYLSTGLNGERIAVSGFVVAPAAPSPTPRPVLAWAHGTVGILPECSVSHTSDPYKQTPSVDLMLQQGFVIVSTDYPGLGTPGIHPYLVGQVEAYSVLDSVRAARQLGVGAGDRFAVWGASQGGQAALWTASLAPSYAPELKLVGAAASAPATDLAGIVRAKIDDQGGGVFIAETLYAWSYAYNANLDSIIRPDKRAQFEKMARTCISTPAAFLTIGGILKPSEYLVSPNALDTEPWRTLLAQNTPRGPIKVPLLITHGDADTLIPIELSAAETARRCAAGESVQFVTLPGVKHDARNESGPIVVPWLKERFAPVAAVPKCGAAGIK